MKTEFTYRQRCKIALTALFRSFRLLPWARLMEVFGSLDPAAPVLKAEGRGWSPDSGVCTGSPWVRVVE